MTSRKIDPKKVTPTTTTDLRGRDPKVLRAEIDVFLKKIAEKTAKEPGKAATVLADWLNKPAAASKAKKAA